MQKKLPARPNLDHLRRQAKALLADLAAGNPGAVTTFQNHLPAARKMTAAEVIAARFRLVDAQSAIARQSGFAAWPHLARHVELLRALEGTWTFAQLEVEGQAMPGEMLKASRLLIDGDRFRTESPDGHHEGVFNINVEAQPHEIDIEFNEGPEAGNWNYGIFQFDEDRLELCLDLNGRPRPTRFAAPAGSGHAHEILTRAARVRPDNVAGGSPSTAVTAAAPAIPPGFEAVKSPTLAKLQGEWGAVRMVRDGQELPAAMLRTARRSADGNEVTISVGGRVAIHALVRLDERSRPVAIDYYNLEGPAKGLVQRGLFRWEGEEACFCIAPPDAPRPEAFEAPRGSGRSLSQWRRGR